MKIRTNTVKANPSEVGNINRFLLGNNPSEEDLSYMEFRGTILRDANLCWADLRGVVLTKKK
jgi:uncharacterized protein YjbI with pentapeptide repeats